ncbi:hypothetical protein P9199_01745 [Geobacillus stearothermophilus]|uniref:hypothetical protein n=1 Tax=Geobacillus stearothermophilus TaxID=1422 RepID=UPI002E208EEE|nr:hypothetical protein [Geobacillus stearothermophilus]
MLISKWTEIEDMKTVWEIINNDVIQTTRRRTSGRKQAIDKIVDKLIQDPDFSARLQAKDPRNTIAQHVRVWIDYLEGKGPKPRKK